MQRGSVQFLSICAGDISRTGECLGDPTLNYTGNLTPSIPVQPLSWEDALPLLRGITNNIINNQTYVNWIGGLNLTYAFGPGPVQVHLEVELTYNTTTIWNVIATINGVQNNQSVIIGNHRDAWVYGASDPSSGSAAMLEVARSYGQLLQSGWVPQRKIIFASWDGEEYALIGSTAYAESNAANLTAGAVIYINVDSGVGGWNFDAAGTSSVLTTLADVVKYVNYPGPGGGTVFDNWDGEYDNLGAGSDYTAFIQHLGIASLDLGFDNMSAGVYHSAYDSFYWMETFVDPQFQYHLAITQIIGLVGLRYAGYAGNTVVPLYYTPYAYLMWNYIEEVSLLLQQLNHTGAVYFASINSAINNFYDVAIRVENERNRLNVNDTNAVSRFNDRLIQTERQFIYPSGLPGRPFYKHVVQAPGLNLGYDPVPFPGIVDGILNYDWEEAQQQVSIVANLIGQAASTLSGSSPSSGSSGPSNTVLIVAIVVPVGALLLIAIVVFLYRRSQRSVYTPVS